MKIEVRTDGMRVIVGVLYIYTAGIVAGILIGIAALIGGWIVIGGLIEWTAKHAGLL